MEHKKERLFKLVLSTHFKMSEADFAEQVDYAMELINSGKTMLNAKLIFYENADGSYGEKTNNVQ